MRTRGNPNIATPHGLTLHHELLLLTRAGLSPAHALRAATATAAAKLGAARLVAVRVGQDADLVVLSADPLGDIGNTRSIEVVLCGGRPHRPAGGWRSTPTDSE
ncbi:hypothetical protein GCM10023322_10390 [Rugosimonospora acidiphila]|uniref:Amidohydrolase-related domain-containing protein n=1 Tax=Rugosimonospora acidiphila TaxID=556531 RepID=A0ABP9RME1_9ACTN